MQKLAMEMLLVMPAMEIVATLSSLMAANRTTNLGMLTSFYNILRLHPRSFCVSQHGSVLSCRTGINNF